MIIRKFKRKYMPQIVEILLAEWDLGRKISGAGEICGWIYLLDCLACADEMYVAIDGKEILGVIGFENYNRPKHKLRRKIYKMLCEKLKKSSAIPDKAGLQKYYDAYNYSKETRGRFDGELTIMILKKIARGRHFGSILFNHICDRARRSGVTRMQIDTDDCCNRDFYERNGCRCVLEKKIECGEKFYAENAFVYEKVLRAGDTI